MSPPALRAARTVQRPAVGRPEQEPAVGRLAAATRIEDRPVEDDQRRVAGRRRPSATRASTVRA